MNSCSWLDDALKPVHGQLNEGRPTLKEFSKLIFQKLSCLNFEIVSDLIYYTIVTNFTVRLYFNVL